jgi:hypothetical protein
MKLSACYFATAAIAGWVSIGQCAWAQEPLRRASGLWEIAVTISGQPTPGVGQYCIDGATDDIAVTAAGGVPQKDCEQARASRQGEGFVIESVCRLGNSTVTSRGVFKGDPASTYSGDLEANYSPPLYGRREVKSRIEAKLLGPCKP